MANFSWRSISHLLEHPFARAAARANGSPSGVRNYSRNASVPPFAARVLPKRPLSTTICSKNLFCLENKCPKYLPSGVAHAQHHREFHDLGGGAKTFTERKVIGYSQEQLFDVVADVGNYKQFLPWCLDSRVLRTTPAGCTAQLEIGFSAIRERYVSNVTLRRPTSILASSQDNQLFRRLINEWHFDPFPHPSGPATVVNIKVTFEFENFLHGVVASAAFDKVVRRMMDAFEGRARTLYGPSTFQSSTVRQPLSM